MKSRAFFLFLFALFTTQAKAADGEFCVQTFNV